jgi:hypothetical protein
MTGRLGAAALLAILVLGLGCPSVVAYTKPDDGHSVTGHGTTDGAVISVSTGTLGGHGSGGGGGGASVGAHHRGGGGGGRGPSPFTDCQVVDTGQYQHGVYGDKSAGDYDGTGFAVEVCTEVATGKLHTRYFTPANPAPAPNSPAPAPPSAVALAYQALAAIHLPLPHIAVPGNGHPQLVGFPVWLWVDNAWTPDHQTAAAPGLAATVTAVPVSTTFSFDDDTAPLHCTGPGTPWHKGIPGSQQHTNCLHTFTHHGHHRVTATITWHLTWTATNGQASTLPNNDRSSSTTLHVQQAQAVID